MKCDLYGLTGFEYEILKANIHRFLCGASLLDALDVLRLLYDSADDGVEISYAGICILKNILSEGEYNVCVG